MQKEDGGYWTFYIHVSYFKTQLCEPFFCVDPFFYVFSADSRMKRTVFCGVVVLCLLSIIHDNNMKAEGSVVTVTRYTLNWMKCCSKNCKLNDRCYPLRPKGCMCQRQDRRLSNGSRWKFFKS